MSHATHSRYSGDPAMWVLLLGDTVMYSLFLVFFGYEYRQQPEVFSQAQSTLHAGFGFFNTLVLLTGSLLVIQAIRQARQNLYSPAQRSLLLAALCGAIFGTCKIIEYSLAVSAGISITSNAFYLYYFALTGFHFLHVAIGTAVLLWMRRHLSLSQQQGSQTANITLLESGANFWHLVDLLWILLFPIIYLV
ncbi:cytochrome c oxidase subunit 3 [Spongiibacter taiwanensis]|uniref:cytochrome c oxidase subunit 3 n=1 Tax=Spongiibacter taiwanensis TaxID=1748242 RepID=UPI0020357005|nr:cytochrome c oxidase subunit 3 [Spongiibacter taiwanensis]USA42581.1 cytochrome c oxidase subunit 3 [Spongiibacter taiwanensis]